MKTNESIEPRDWDLAAQRAEIQEWQRNTAALVATLQDESRCDAAAVWWPHRHQMIAALQQFVEFCEQELVCFGSWNEEELAPEEIHEIIWMEGQRLVMWLERMLGSDCAAGVEKSAAGDGI